MSVLDEFKNRLPNDWLIPFCSSRGLSREGFIDTSLKKLSAIDARDFMQAIDNGFVHHHNGTFTAACSKVKEQIFFHGSKKSVPREVHLWLEPIITMAGLTRLVRDFGWPAYRLGMQSQTWAFDLVAYDEDQKTELLACEVKKTEKEVDKLLELMEKHAGTSAEAASELKGPEKNAVKKVSGLPQSVSTIFWVLGPNRYGKVFNVLRTPDGRVTLHSTDESALVFSGV